MPKVTAKLNYCHIAPRKLRLLADLIRGQKVLQAKSFLDLSIKRGSLPMQKLLNSAIAAAKNTFSLKTEDLFIKEIKVDQAPKMKRWRPRSRGRAMRIEKKTSHITIILDELKISN